MLSLVMQPIDEFAALLEGAIDPPHEFLLLDAEDRKNSIDVRQRRLTNVGSWLFRRLQHADIYKLATVSIQD